MLLKLLSRLIVIFFSICVIFIFIAQSLKIPEGECDPKNVYQKSYPENMLSVVHICSDRTHSPLSISIKSSEFIPIPIHGYIAQIPDWSPEESQFVFAVKSFVGSEPIYSYFLYDTFDKKLQFLYRSPLSYGIVWEDHNTFLLVRLDQLYLCYRYYKVKHNGLIEYHAPSLLVNVQCTSNVCVRIDMSGDMC